MDRRWVGLLIFFVVIVTAVVVPHAIGQTVAGTPQATVVPGPPQIGSCLPVAPSDSLSRSDPYPQEALLPCAGRRFGEVMAIIDDRRTPVRTLIQPGTAPSGQRSQGRATVDPNRDPCTDELGRYVGESAAPTNVSWRPASFLSVTASGPSAYQRAAGQHWVACELVLVGPAGSPAPYTGSARNSSVGDAPIEFAVCLESASVTDYRELDCSNPHYVELFGGLRTQHPGLSQQLLDQTCLQDVQRQTKMADPTAGGQLVVTAAAVHGADTVPSIAGLGSASDPTGFAICTLSSPAHRLLARSLLGLGASALPWVA